MIQHSLKNKYSVYLNRIRWSFFKYWQRITSLHLIIIFGFLIPITIHFKINQLLYVEVQNEKQLVNDMSTYIDKEATEFPLIKSKKEQFLEFLPQEREKHGQLEQLKKEIENSQIKIVNIDYQSKVSLNESIFEQKLVMKLEGQKENQISFIFNTLNKFKNASVNKFVINAENDSAFLSIEISLLYRAVHA